jgi:putative transposase
LGSGKSPWLKGSIERFIKTSGTDVFHATPGTTFSNFLVRGDYDPSKHACVTLNGLWYLLHKWIVDVYTQEAHRGIGGVPAKIWERGLNRDFVPRLPASRNRHLPVQFKYNAGDLSRIWVLDPRKMKYLEVLADDQYYTQGLSLWKHRVIKRYAKEEMKRDINREALTLAKEELHRAIYEEFRQEKKLGGRKKGNGD